MRSWKSTMSSTPRSNPCSSRRTSSCWACKQPTPNLKQVMLPPCTYICAAMLNSLVAAEMRNLKATSAEAESNLSARVEELQVELQDLRFQSNELILRQQEHYEAQKRALQARPAAHWRCGTRQLPPCSLQPFLPPCLARSLVPHVPCPAPSTPLVLMPLPIAPVLPAEGSGRGGRGDRAAAPGHGCSLHHAGMFWSLPSWLWLICRASLLPTRLAPAQQQTQVLGVAGGQCTASAEPETWGLCSRQRVRRKLYPWHPHHMDS
jgi:hypothetical protein